MSLRMWQKNRVNFQKIAIYDRAKANSSQAHVDIPNVGWSTEVNQRWSIIRDTVQQQCRALYPTTVIFL